jgi:hypothetical protein
VDGPVTRSDGRLRDHRSGERRESGGRVAAGSSGSGRDGSGDLSAASSKPKLIADAPCGSPQVGTTARTRHESEVDDEPPLAGLESVTVQVTTRRQAGSHERGRWLYWRRSTSPQDGPSLVLSLGITTLGACHRLDPTQVVPPELRRCKFQGSPFSPAAACGPSPARQGSASPLRALDRLLPAHRQHLRERRPQSVGYQGEPEELCCYFKSSPAGVTARRGRASLA